MKIITWIDDKIALYWNWRFNRLHRKWLTVYERRIKPTQAHLKGQDYVSTSVVADARTGKVLQMDVFSSGSAELLAQDRLQAAFFARQQALAAMGLDEEGQPLEIGDGNG